jgi:protein TonB
MPSPLARGPAPQPALSDGDLLRIIGIEPAYPPDAFRNRIEGWAEVEFTVDVSGTPRDIAVTGAEPSGVFDAAAADAVAGWRYRPRVVNGRAVPQRTSVTLRFNVAD